MKLRKHLILIVMIGAVCGIGAILLRLNVMVNQKEIKKPVPEANIVDKQANTTDRENKQLRERIRSLEDTIAKMEEKIARQKIRTGWGTLPGLGGSLVGLSCIGINIEEPPITAVRYGLTKKNILKAVESQLSQHNIKTFYYPRDSESNSIDSINLYSDIEDKPQLNIEVDCVELKDEKYKALVSVSMKQYWTDEKAIPADYFEKVKKQGIHAVEKTIKTYPHITTWECQCLLLGKMGNFAEDERDTIEELVQGFVDVYLAKNPK